METKTSARPGATLARRFKPKGMALILTVFILGMLTILVVGFLSSMMTEEKASYAFENSQRAKLVAQGAVNHAIDILRTNIPEPARISEGPSIAPAENWITNPGRLTIVRPNQPPQYIPLHTGEVTTTPPTGQPADAESVNLNKPLPGQTNPAIVASPSGGTAPVMRVKWVNVLQNPSIIAGPNNRLSSRYAFWIDDESTKINFNTALGKPRTTSTDPFFGPQLSNGFVTPLFARGDSNIVYSGSSTERAKWALGKPQSVNLDSLLPSPELLQHDKLLAHTFLHGFARYPEAIMDFVGVPSPKEWYEQNKFNLTFYNRSPEFNAFGRSRFFTTLVPLSLEAGPSYQHPFIHDPEGSYNEASRDKQVLNLNSLLGNFGFTAAIEDENGDTVNGGNVVNRSQLNMLVSYLNRKWPGYSESFVDKYGWMESYQIALNALLMARVATTGISTDTTNFSKDYSARSTSVNYSPDNNELPGSTPERMYWRIQDPTTGNTKLMLPQTPGPHITEVRLFVKSVDATALGAPKDGWGSVPAGKRRYIQYYYEVEYYMHDHGPVVDLANFPTRVDYLDITAISGTKVVNQFFGPKSPGGAMGRNDRNWNNNGNQQNIRKLQIIPPVDTLIGPAGATCKDSEDKTVNVSNRIVIRSEPLLIGSRPSAVPFKTGSDVAFWDPVVFNSNGGTPAGSANIRIRFRPGMGVQAVARPRQMIPLGENETDTLQAVFPFNIALSGTENVIAWQINDPRLSHDLSQWEIAGPGIGNAVGSPGDRNDNEPDDSSNEKSKFRYISRAPSEAKVHIDGRAFDLDRPDEYNTASRVSSIGYWSMLHTGMQSGVPWRTLNLQPSSTTSTTLPDYLLLDLMGATYPMSQDQWKIDATLPDSFSTASYMNSTAGQVNINSRIYPQNSTSFNPPARIQPTEAVFKYLRADTQIKYLTDNIKNYQTDVQLFDYPGELVEVAGYVESTSDTQWKQESLLRNMAGVLTTKTNTFGMWGVAQVVKKTKSNSSHGTFETGDLVLGEKRFYALIERYIWAGRDGVPGNAHIDTQGKWDRLAVQTASINLSGGITDNLFQLPGSPPLRRVNNNTRLQLDATGSYPEFDGPEQVGADAPTKASLGDVRFRLSKLEDAYNPPQAAVKYRVVYFKYLDQ